MSTRYPTPRRRLRTVTPTQVALGILLALMALSLAVPVASTYGVLAYLGLVAITARVVSGVRREPGSWLGLRIVRRSVVVLLAAVCIGLLATPPPTVNGNTGSESDTGALVALFMVMILLNVALGRATQRVASAPDAVVDERQEAIRNRAHRIAYVVLLLAAGGVLLVADLDSQQSRAWLGATVSWSGWIVFLELLFVLPAMVLAFIEPDRVEPEAGERHAASTTRQRAAGALLALSFAIPLALSVSLAVLPPSVAASSSGSVITTTSASGGAAGTSDCRHFQADVVVGRGIQAEIPLNAVACWNGATASVSYGMASSDCHPGDYVAVSVRTLLCSTTTLPDGTLAFRYRALVSSSLLPFLGRTVTVEVVIDKHGHVLEFP